jgi:signal recognition particle subunit SRP54
MKHMGSGKRGPLASLGNMLGLGGGMPSPDEIAKLAAKMPGGVPGLPPGLPGAPNLPAKFPGLGGPPSLPGLGGKLPGLGGLPGLGRGPDKKK